MADALGIEHLTDLTNGEAVAAFFTPLIIFAVFFVLQIILPARKVTGYVTDRDTGEPRNYRLNGLLVFAIAHLVWAFGLFDLPRDWFYRSSLWAVVGGTVFCAIFAVWSVFTQPKGEITNPWLALWEGRSQELQLFGGRIDIKMWWYVVGGTMLSLNALSGAVWHHNRFGDDANPGIYLYAAFWAFYTFDYFIWERVQLYTYDLIHEHIGFKLWWGGLVAYGWLFILPLWGMAAHPDPGYSTGLTYFWLIAVCVLFLGGWTIGRGANLQKYTFKRWPDRKFLWVEPEYIEAGERKILCSGWWRPARHFNYLGEGILAVSFALVFGHPGNLWAWTYSIFVISFFTVRQRFDERACEQKYGPEKWAEYQAKVKYRIFPGIY
ncbi:MAG: DUF1295 domain-containing protein [Acidimicrobiaceae bacterium]|nr:DUF1295 domain-containing protein [Acidimicrobiaceae bacterium]MDE0667280.1 DUF1295 domain-containing protein [Acidimicrobiaceae bacterium]MXY12155.1 DUF1295 domain-containing protein [Acidimicrobiaceae bacterium]MXZ66587.1 DUF1295 domain-containing protein [Acidimicrobiaceae bacterium]MYF34773.1 DUF1295 domain-containing protein [Acidimicrobiaceae bacterium]